MLKQFSIWICGYDLSKYRPGIGPNSWGYWRIIIPYQGLFFECGVEHDRRYCEGTTEEDRRLADHIFYAECLALSKNLLQKLTASIYFNSLRKFGHNYFNYQQK